MVEISMSGSGEGLGWATGPGYSTIHEQVLVKSGSAFERRRRVPTIGGIAPLPRHSSPTLFSKTYHFG